VGLACRFCGVGIAREQAGVRYRGGAFRLSHLNKQLSEIVGRQWRLLATM